jgi:hypothetical protein
MSKNRVLHAYLQYLIVELVVEYKIYFYEKMRYAVEIK